MLQPVRRMRSTLGTMCDPHTAWLLMRSLETLKLRMEAGARGATAGRAVPARSPEDRQRLVPRLPAGGSRRSRSARAAEQERRLDVLLRGEGRREGAFAVLDNLQVIKLAVSLGGTETLASHPAVDDALGHAREELKRFSITPALIRISIGIENPDDLVADLEQALRAVPA